MHPFTCSVPSQIDKLSMDKVTVFPDGELNIDAVASVPGTAAFHRPISAGELAHFSQIHE